MEEMLKKEDQMNMISNNSSSSNHFSVFPDHTGNEVIGHGNINYSWGCEYEYDEHYDEIGGVTEKGFGFNYLGSFMDMVGIQDFPQNSLFDLLSLPPPPPVLLPSSDPQNKQNNNKQDCKEEGEDQEKVVNTTPSSSTPAAGDSSEVVNTAPATPNSVSNISSSSSDAAIDHPDPTQNSSPHKFKNQLKVVKKKKQKRVKEPRFAFMTRTEIDHLDDGYRWRKYGQKAVKNSPFPRSYYRCTTAACGVKKRVERSCDDPTIVVTTYEGQHTHPCPVVTRGSLGLSLLPPPLNQPTATTFGDGGGGASSASTFSLLHYHHPHHQLIPMSTYNVPNNTINTVAPPPHSSMTFTSSCGGGSGDGSGRGSPFSLSSVLMANYQLRDDGLLQDIVPSAQANNGSTTST